MYLLVIPPIIALKFCRSIQYFLLGYNVFHPLMVKFSQTNHEVHSLRLSLNLAFSVLLKDCTLLDILIERNMLLLLMLSVDFQSLSTHQYFCNDLMILPKICMFLALLA